MADAAVSFVVERLGDLLIQKASSVRSVSKNVERLKSELIHMQGFLKAADAWPHRNDGELQNLVAEIRDLAHDAEDIIESRAFAAKKSTLRRMLNSWSVASEIDEFTSKITDLGGRLQRYGNGIIIREAGKQVSGTTQQDLLRPLRRTYTHVAEQHDVIGLEEDAETIATKLIDGTLGSRTVFICGMGGIGKTTLAKKVYGNIEVGRHFNNRLAWGSVSQQHKERDIWLNILTKLASPDESERRLLSVLTDEEIAKKLYQLLVKEKCLVVLDDIWTKEAWDCLRAGFPEANNRESKILLTTRNREVALHVDPKCFIHSPRCLNESQSWELFRSVAIRHREEAGFIFDENLEELGRRIVNRCGGLPLAIKTIGGNLQTKSSIDEWTMVYNNMVSHLRGVDNGLTELRIMSLLALSYHYLPYQLKQCFLHFSYFPEDFIIPIDTIINIWVAEGIILKGSTGEEPIVEVEDIAYAFLEDLVSRCMIQVEKRSSIGKIKSFRLHDLMRDLCIQEAKKENFGHAKYLESGHDEATIQLTSIGKFRHLALYMKNSNQGPNLNDDMYDHVRSLLVFCNNMEPVFLNKSLSVAMTRPFKYLRLLYLDGGEIDLEIPKEIGYLIHLRLFDMGSMRTKHLPSSLGKLTQLLTLKLDRLLNVENMPNIFESMHQLRHLYLPASAKFSVGNMKLRQLRNLQTLVNLPLKFVKIEDLVGLPSLKKLKLELSEEDGFKRLVEMFNTSPNATFKKLRSLSISVSWNLREFTIEMTKVAATCPHLHKLKFIGPLMWDLAEESQIFRHLNELTLKSSNFVKDPMPHLGKLPSLRVLHLDSTLGIDKIMFPKNSFPCLQFLALEWEELLREWIIEEGSLPRLSILRLSFCYNLKTLPRGLEFVDSLQELQIGIMPEEFEERIMDSHIVKNKRLRWFYNLPPPPPLPPRLSSLALCVSPRN